MNTWKRNPTVSSYRVRNIHSEIGWNLLRWQRVGGTVEIRLRPSASKSGALAFTTSGSSAPEKEPQYDFPVILPNSFSTPKRTDMWLYIVIF